MLLAIEVERDGRTESLEIGTELEDPSDIARVVALVGSDPVNTLARGEWSPVAARGFIYVNLLRALDADFADPPFKFDEMTLDWGEMTPYMDADPEMESALAELSEVES